MSVPYTFTAGETAQADEVNANFAAVDTNPTTTSSGVADAGRSTLLNASGRVDTTLLAPDGYLRVDRAIYSLGADIGYPGTFSGTVIYNSAQQTYGTSDSVGATTIRFSADSKGIREYYGKSRGAAIGDFTICQAGDRIVTRQYEGVGNGQYFGHAGAEYWLVDWPNPAHSGELGGRWRIATGTGVSASGGFGGVQTALDINYKQQVLIPGALTNSANIPAAGADFGAVLVLGVGGSSAGQAPLKFTLSGAALLTAPVAGIVEPDSNGTFYITNASAKRSAIMVGQVKTGGDSGAIAVGAAAGTGATASVAWGNGVARVTVNTGTGTTTGTICTLTYPFAFGTGSYVWIQAANANAAVFMGRNCYTTTSTSNVVIATPTDTMTASNEYIFDVFFVGT